MDKLKIAVIGSGISGLSCASYLSKKYTIDVYEKNDYFGGHSNTQTIRLDGKNINIDTGFIVFNELNYPTLCNFFDNLNVKSYESDMSFSVSMNNGALQYSGSSISSIFAQRKNLLNFQFLKMLYEIVKFYREVEKDKVEFVNLTISEYLKKKRYSEFFKFNHLYPMAASIWSSPINEITKYPFAEFVNFFSNHGLLKIFNRPKWRTVKGGSKEYIKKILMNKNIKAHKNSDVTIKKKKSGFWELKVNNKVKNYNHIILGIHSDQVNTILKDFNDNKYNVFSQIKFNKNEVYLHSDPKLMPKNRNVWASWNYLENKSEISVTYWMNLLQELDTNINFFVSLNPEFLPDIKKIEKKIIYHHPVFDFKTFEAQKKINLIQGKNNLWFCGAYLGYGFHEDGIKSGERVAKKILKDL